MPVVICIFQEINNSYVGLDIRLNESIVVTKSLIVIILRNMRDIVSTLTHWRISPSYSIQNVRLDIL